MLVLDMDLTLRAHLRVHLPLMLAFHVSIQMTRWARMSFWLALMLALHVRVLEPSLLLHKWLLPADWLPRPLVLRWRQLRLLRSLHTLHQHSHQDCPQKQAQDVTVL